MEHGITPPEYNANEVSLSCSWAQHAVNPAETIMNADHAPAQPAVDLNNNSINTPNPVSDGITNVGLNIDAVSPNTPSILGDIFSAGSNILDNVAEVSAYVSGGPQLNNTTQPVQQITASIDDGPQIKVNDSVTGFQNNFSTPNIA